jgi:drug/metabolite transporter (DMT)-like permease
MPNTNATPPENLRLGIVLTVLGFLCVAIMSAFAKAASASASAGILVFFQSAISLLLLVPWVLWMGVADLKTGRLGLHFVRAIAGLLSQYFFFLAVSNISLLDAVLLVNAAPLFIPFVALIWLKTRIEGKLWLGLGLGFLGIVLILQPGAGVFHWASLLALIAGVFSAIALVGQGRLTVTEPASRILFYYFLISSVLTAPLAIARWTAPDPSAWMWLLGVGVFMMASQLFLVMAYAHASAAKVSPFNYSVVVFAGLIDWLVWDRVPNLLSVAGVLLVCVGGVIATIHHQQTKDSPSSRKRATIPEPADPRAAELTGKGALP